MKKKINFIKIFFTVTILFVCGCIIAFPERYVSSAKKGILLWANNVLPSLFPFFFCTLLLSKTGALHCFTKACSGITQKLFRCSGEVGYVFLMSLISGYPVGAKMISELYSEGKIDKYEATRASCLCSTSGPLFVIGAVGANMLCDKTLGYILFAVHILSVMICGKIFCNYGDFNKSYTCRKPETDGGNILYECVYSSVISILIVGGLICIFYVISDVFFDFKITYPVEFLLEKIIGCNNAEGFVKGMIECTNGCNVLSKQVTPLSVALIGGCISFGGISVIAQSVIFLKKAEVNLGMFLLSKIIQSVITILLCFALISFIY